METSQYTNDFVKEVQAKIREAKRHKIRKLQSSLFKAIFVGRFSHLYFISTLVICYCVPMILHFGPYFLECALVLFPQVLFSKYILQGIVQGRPFLIFPWLFLSYIEYLCYTISTIRMAYNTSADDFDFLLTSVLLLTNIPIWFGFLTVVRSVWLLHWYHKSKKTMKYSSAFQRVKNKHVK